MISGFRAGGNILISLSALLPSLTTSVTRVEGVRALNLVQSRFFLIFTELVSLRFTKDKKYLMSVVCFGYEGND